jgi:hypothetical protein
LRLSHHAKQQGRNKGYTEAEILDAALNPTLTYESHSHPWQHRHVRGGLCAVVDRATGLVVTVYANVDRTALRADQVA